jgi:acetyl-CoA carboxylase carboxyltransferase component
VMGPEPAVNAFFFNKIQAISNPEERAAFVAEKRREFEEDINLLHLASEMVVDEVVQPDDLRANLSRRLGQARTKDRTFSARRHGVPPV